MAYMSIPPGPQPKPEPEPPKPEPEKPKKPWWKRWKPIAAACSAIAVSVFTATGGAADLWKKIKGGDDAKAAVTINGNGNVTNIGPNNGIVADKVIVGQPQRSMSDADKQFVRDHIPAGSPIMFHTAAGDGGDSGRLMFAIQEWVVSAGYQIAGAGQRTFAGPPPKGVQLLAPNSPGNNFPVWTIYVGPP